jgi:hypothetical protein
MLATSAILPAVLATRPAIPPIVLMVLTNFPNDAFSDGREVGEVNDIVGFADSLGIIRRLVVGCCCMLIMNAK